MDAQRALLDELMGSARNLTEEERKGHREIKWDDKDVCGCYMVRFCPHDLFVNTRSDLGVCPKIHDPKLKESCQNSKAPRREAMVPRLSNPPGDESDKATAWGRLGLGSEEAKGEEKRRLFMPRRHLKNRNSFEKSPRHDSYVPKFEAELAHFCERLAKKAEQLSVLEEKIKNLLEQVESLGEAGKVDEAEALMRKVEMLNIEKTVLTQQPQQDKLLMVAQEKKMALCEICGSFLVANDAAERTQSHVTGKQHMGYGMVRDFLAEHKEAKEKAREEERLAREKEAEERKKMREKESESKRRRSGSADRDRYRERDYDRERDRYRDRDHERSRERNGRGSREGGRGSDRKNSSSINGRESSRDRYRDRSRSPQAWSQEVIEESTLEDFLELYLNSEEVLFPFSVVTQVHAM
ncbi:hypothetical protein DH2020_048369 [Rehmannia glutinosa]|uniref:Luc7-like protein n=1 Tax=Rehmannia glutinosa TaxID=99300 RepID=A0ABR0U6C7_REHGL